MARLTSLLLVLWVGVTASTVVDLQKRVIGGRDCGRTERRYHVEVKAYAVDGRFTYCGGSLIGNRWILTAAHCWNSTRIMRAVLGIHPGGQGTEVDIHRHHIYTDNQNRPHDIMLLQLTNPTLIKPVPLPDCTHPLNIGDRVKTAGRGSMTMGLNNERQRGRAAVLQCANTMVVDCQRHLNCLQRNYPVDYAFYGYQHRQCFQRAGVDISPGDSGGGVVFNGRIYGVNVNIGSITHACVEAAGFMDVCRYMDWIVGTTGIARPKPKLPCLNCFKG